MKKICILLMGGLPLPATKGGGIETLVDILIRQNEITPKYHFTVLCVYDQEAERQSRDFKYTEFVFFRHHRIADRLLERFSRILYRATRIVIPHSVEFAEALKFLKKNRNYDYILNETWKVYLLPLISRVVEKEKIILHLHRKGEESKGDITKRIDNSFGILITVSKFVANDWTAITGRAKEHVFVLPNCCNTPMIAKKTSDSEKQALWKKYNIKPDETVLIFVGRVTDEKGVVELVQALNNLHNSKIHLILIGGSSNMDSNSYEQSVKQEIKKASYPVSVIGSVSNSEIYKYFNISDLAVLPSKCPDAALLTGIEAMTAGLPTISTNQGGIPEYLKDNVAILVDTDAVFIDSLSAAIKTLIDNRALRNKMAENTVSESKKHTPESYFKNFDRIIEGLKD